MDYLEAYRIAIAWERDMWSDTNNLHNQMPTPANAHCRNSAQQTSPSKIECQPDGIDSSPDEPATNAYSPVDKKKQLVPSEIMKQCRNTCHTSPEPQPKILDTCFEEHKHDDHV